MRRALACFLMTIAVACVSPGWAAGAAEAPANRWAILISGISGDPKLQEQFLGWLRDMHALLIGPLQFPRSHVHVLFDDPAKDTALVSAKSTRESLERVTRELSAQVGKDDLVFVFILGHGNFDSRGYKLNLPGPDPTAEDLAAALYAIPAGRFVVANMTTCSGASIEPLSGRNRIVVSATKSGHEKNQTHTGRFFIEAFKEGKADVDKNGRVSILEAFQYAARAVGEHYERLGNLQTEHPVLEDSGDGLAEAAPGPENGEGFLARTTYLDAGSALLTREGATEQERALAREAQSLERRIEELKYRKAEMPAEEYEKNLESLLLRLAEINVLLRNKN